MPRTASSNFSSIWPSPTRNWKPSSPCRRQRLAVDLAFEVDGGAVAGLAAASSLAGRWAKVRRCLRRMSTVLSMASSVTSAGDALHLGLAQIADLDFGYTSKVASKPSGLRALRTLLNDGLGGHAQLGFVGRAGEGLADLVVHTSYCTSSRSAGPPRSSAPCRDGSRRHLDRARPASSGGTRLRC